VRGEVTIDTVRVWVVIFGVTGMMFIFQFCRFGVCFFVLSTFVYAQQVKKNLRGNEEDNFVFGDYRLHDFGGKGLR
jgi:hypothetical protein